MKTLDQLILATSWGNIRETPEGFIIRFDVEDSYQIKGLKTSLHTYFLDFSDFEDTPIVFEVGTPGGGIVQYWTLHRNLHRASGKPSYIHHNNSVIVMSWYHNGMINRDKFPASITIENPDFQSDGMIHFSKLAWLWRINGGTPVYPNAQSAVFHKGMLNQNFMTENKVDISADNMVIYLDDDQRLIKTMPLLGRIYVESPHFRWDEKPLNTGDAREFRFYTDDGKIDVNADEFAGTETFNRDILPYLDFYQNPFMTVENQFFMVDFLGQYMDQK